MRTVSLLVLAGAAGCGSSQPVLATQPHGYASRMENADAHDAAADSLRTSAHGSGLVLNPQDYQCGDVDMSDQLTSGGQRMVNQVPCWDPAEERAERHRIAALREDEIARRERRAAARLVEAEQEACRGISPSEIAHSPFSHRSAIASVTAERSGDTVRGVRIVFKPVSGLNATWMEQAIACHRARFERLGEPPTYLSDDPTLVSGATATVVTRAGRNGHWIEVLVETRDDVAAHVALGRAEDLVRERTAGR